MNEVKGYCNYCGKLYAGKITDKDGAVRYVESLQNSDFGNGNTVTLLQDITGTVTPGSSCTIELRGRSVGQIDFAVQDGTLTLKGQGKIGTVTLGSGEIDSTLAIEDTAYWQRVKIGTLTINKTTNTRLSGGQFDQDRAEGRRLRGGSAGGRLRLLRQGVGDAGVRRRQDEPDQDILYRRTQPLVHREH